MKQAGGTACLDESGPKSDLVRLNASLCNPVRIGVPKLRPL